MGFKSLIKSQVQNAMKILGTDEDGLARSQTFVSVSEGTYDPATRTVSPVEAEYPAVPMALVRFSLEDMDDKVRPQTDRVALIASLDLPVEPDENDQIKTHHGHTYTVLRVMSDPADALYKLHIRKE